MKEEVEKLPPRVPWRGTSLRWGHAVTTTALGVGRDNLSDAHEMYEMSWQLMLNYFLADMDDWKLSVFAGPGFGVELTNSDVTTTEHEPQFMDLPVGVTYARTIFKSDGGDFVTSGSGSYVLIFPTSPFSYEIGTYLTTSPRLALSQTFPLAGQDAPVFQSVAIGGNFRWDHRFGAATTAVNEELNRPRQTAAGDTFLSDQVGFSPLATDTLREGVFLSFPSTIGEMELVLTGTFAFSHAFKGEFEGSDCEVELVTGCVKADSAPDMRTSQNSVGFGASVLFFPVPEGGISLGYANSSLQLGPDGERRSIFYSPGALFTADLLISIDAIYERITGPPRSGSYVLAKNKDKRKRRSTAMSFLF